MAQQISRNPTVSRRVVATYKSYSEAQRAVDRLSDEDFPVNHVSIVAEDLRLVEQVTGSLNYGRAALNGALSGGIAGALFGFIFGLFDWITPLISALAVALYGFLFGAVIGAIIGLIAYAASRGERDFMSVSGLQAARYNIMVADEFADLAARLLGTYREEAPPAPAAHEPGYLSEETPVHH